MSSKIRDFLLFSGAFAENPSSEQVLADRFNVSRTPIRDALRELEVDGFIVRRRGKGVHLAQPSVKDISDYYDFRSAMEAFAAGLACKRATDDQIMELRHWAEKFTQARQNQCSRIMDESNMAFHGLLIDLAGNLPLKRSMERFGILVKTFTMGHGIEHLTGRPLPATEYPHELIVESILQRDPEASQETVRQHIQEAKKILLQRTLDVQL